MINNDSIATSLSRQAVKNLARGPRVSVFHLTYRHVTTKPKLAKIERLVLRGIIHFFRETRRVAMMFKKVAPIAMAAMTGIWSAMVERTRPEPTIEPIQPANP